ncbi:glycoside hydrolase family 5 protein [Dactylosporangium sp. McL0621]|uniref:glycoside hydrolase family 5 protein n=1 Tax=Dactylosporangium sp. McL0621 TaxID=3415678 RepID=UPI003CF64B95
MTVTRAHVARPGRPQHPAGPPARASAPARHRAPTRWRAIVGAAAASALLCTLILSATIVAWRLSRPAPVIVCGTDPLQAAAVAGLADFAQWLHREDATGFVGEVGWPSGPDADSWNALADTWYRAADAIGLPVTAWAAGQWPANYRMAVYRTGGAGSTLDSAGGQAAVVEAHPSTARYPRGVALAGGSFGSADPGFSNLSPGRYGPDYSYENDAAYAYLAGRGVRLVRLAVSWERLQTRPFGPLADAEVDRVRTAVTRAAAAGLTVVLDLHGYGDYALGGPDGVRRVVLGGPELPADALADLWSRLAAATAGLPGLIGFGLLNEPSRLAAKGRDAALVWERAAQQSVDAIRRAGARQTLLVSGYAQMAPGDWGRMHPHAWVRDPLRRVAYEAHDYFDQDNSGRYRTAYADEMARFAATAPLCRRLVPLLRPPFTARRSA